MIISQRERFHQNAWIITFYAYKGGTGRTLALSNVARFLAEEAGYRVGIIDLDIDSPGLPHQALSVDLDPGSDQRNRVQEEIDEAGGFADLFLFRASQAKPGIDLADRARDLSGFAENSDKCAISLKVRGLGALILMPSGKGAFKKGDEYRARASLFNEATSALGLETSAALLTKIVAHFVDHFALDFVLIDARTGTGNFFPTYTYVVPQALVLFLGLNEQNVHGSLSILSQEAPQKVRPARVILVASPVPTVNPAGLEAGLQRITDQLARMLDEQQANPRHLRFALPTRLDLQLPYCDLATYQETYFVDKYPSSLLSYGYRKLAKELQRLVISPSDPEEKGRAGTPTPSRQRISIALEDVNYQHMQVFLKKHGYIEREAKKHSEPAVARFVLDERESDVLSLPSEIELRLWSATNSQAPWEKIISQPEDKSLPDILMVPQSSLGILGTGTSVWTLEELRRQLRVACLGSDFLDTHYPGWRKWCAYGPSTFGLPFSMATTILCVNRSLFQKQFASYIADIYGNERNGNLFPTSWQQLYRLLIWFAATRSPEAVSPFGFADEDRALYYEWLNVVLACGGADFRTEEGNFSALPAVGECESLEGTWLFLGLAQRLQEIYRGLAGFEARPGGRSMSSLVTEFNQGRLSMYIAWSDNFLFTPIDENGAFTSKPVRLPKCKGWDNGEVGVEDMVLGQIPRDVRHQRNPLVAGWLMTFPRRGDKRIGSATRAGVSFADFFYQPNQQRDLLTRGFPSPSLPLVDLELDELEVKRFGEHHQHETNFRFFLLSLRDGLVRGHWVPAFPGARKGIDSIRLFLRNLIARQDLQYQTLCEEMRTLEEELRKIVTPPIEEE